MKPLIWLALIAFAALLIAAAVYTAGDCDAGLRARATMSECK